MPTTPNGRGLGLVFATPDARNWPYSHSRNLLQLGAPRDIDLRDRMQPVGNQGQLGSCTGWAGTASLEAALGDGQQRSPLYVYYYDRREDGTPPSQDAGATMLGLCKALKDYGAPPELLWPAGMPWQVEPAQDSQQAAARIDAYYQVQGSGLALLQGLWAALEAGEVPLLALNVYPSFEQVGRDGKVRMPVAGESVLGGHALPACMWFNDQSAPGGYGYIGCQNSWGAEMGDGGYFYLPAGYFTSGIVREGWVISVSAPVPPAPPEPDVGDVDQAGREMDAAIALLDAARYNLRGTDPDAAWTYVGEASRIMGVARDRLPKVPPPGPPDPTPLPQFVSPIPNGAVYGRTKWLPGSTGVDLFVRRGTVVKAPADCIIEEILGGTGLQGGAELILSLPDKSWSWRYRHVRTYTRLHVGDRMRQAQDVAEVYDTSLDQLGNPPAWSQPMPDKYQHLDLSVNRGTDQFSPQGGGGGNVDADEWMESIGYVGRRLDRTPGPPDAGVGMVESVKMMTPAGRR